jgi:hypothetical protein
MTEPGSAPSNSGRNGTTLDQLKNLNWPTVVLILISGGSNLFQTQQGNTEIQQAVREIHLVYNKIDEFEDRQKALIVSSKDLAESNSVQLKNQLAMLQKADQQLGQLNLIVRSMHGEQVRKNSAPDHFEP